MYLGQWTLLLMVIGAVGCTGEIARVHDIDAEMSASQDRDAGIADADTVDGNPAPMPPDDGGTSPPPVVDAGPPRGDCDGVTSNGAETTLNTLAHCGGCGIACTGAVGAVVSCATGACKTTGCAYGYMPQMGGGCTNINECAGGVCGVGQCVDGLGSYACNCPNGYTFAGGTCADKNECVGSLCPTYKTCVNTVGSYQCTCPPLAPGVRRPMCGGKMIAFHKTTYFSAKLWSLPPSTGQCRLCNTCNIDWSQSPAKLWGILVFNITFGENSARVYPDFGEHEGWRLENASPSLDSWMGVNGMSYEVSLNQPITLVLRHSGGARYVLVVTIAAGATPVLTINSSEAC